MKKLYHQAGVTIGLTLLAPAVLAAPEELVRTITVEWPMYAFLVFVVIVGARSITFPTAQAPIPHGPSVFKTSIVSRHIITPSLG